MNITGYSVWVRRADGEVLIFTLDGVLTEDAARRAIRGFLADGVGVTLFPIVDATVIELDI